MRLANPSPDQPKKQTNKTNSMIEMKQTDTMKKKKEKKKEKSIQIERD